MNDLDELFARIDADPTMPHPGDIDRLITYYREQRAAKGQPKSARKPAAPAAKIDLVEIGLKPAPQPVAIRRRV